LGVSQQTVQTYDVGQRRIPVPTLRLLAKTLPVSRDELMAEGEHAPRNCGPRRRFSGSWSASARNRSPSSVR